MIRADPGGERGVGIRRVWEGGEGQGSVWICWGLDGS